MIWKLQKQLLHASTTLSLNDRHSSLTSAQIPCTLHSPEETQPTVLCIGQWKLARTGNEGLWPDLKKVLT